MSYQCAHCGETHDELPQYFLCRTPENAKGKALDVEPSRSTGRRGRGRGTARARVRLSHW